MTPTPELRFVVREISRHQMITRMIVLQQWWVSPDLFDMITGQPAGEWRDVPLVKEQQ